MKWYSRKTAGMFLKGHLLESCFHLLKVVKVYQDRRSEVQQNSHNINHLKCVCARLADQEHISNNYQNKMQFRWAVRTQLTVTFDTNKSIWHKSQQIANDWTQHPALQQSNNLFISQGEQNKKQVFTTRMLRSAVYEAFLNNCFLNGMLIAEMTLFWATALH